jgi:hypothetical protein
VEKQCKVCLETKPLSEFYKHPQMADGHLGKCKECQKAATMKARAADPERYREYDRDRAKLPHRIAAAIATTRKWRAADLRRAKCHGAVASALKAGKITPEPCVVCGDERTEAHHPSYDLPLDVVWLCPLHHKQLHLKKSGE